MEHSKVIVAGGASGIGLSAAIRLAAAKAAVTVTGRDEAKLKTVVAEHPLIHTQQLDSSNRAALDAFFSTYGAIDHLVIALSGGKGSGEFAGLPLDDLREGFEGKFWPQLQTLQAALPYMKAGGSITVITAISASAGMPGTSGLAAINGALELMIPILAKEIKPVRINAVSPGVIDTAWWNFLPADAKQQAFAQYATQIPAGRVGKPEEVADAILFLAGNNYMTGSVLHCDGGLGC